MSKKEETTTVDIVIRLQVKGSPAQAASYRDALDSLASVMLVQAEDGLWSLGYEDAEAEEDDPPNEFVTHFESTSVQAILINGADESTKGISVNKTMPMTSSSPSNDEHMRAAWHKGADHFRKLAADRADEGTSVQLACLVLAEYCTYNGSGDYGGPTLEMVDLAENTVGETLDEVVTAQLPKEV